jgi:hypothetical protein
MSYHEHPRPPPDFDKRRSIGGILLRILGGVAVVVVSFWGSLQLMNEWFPPLNAGEIRVVEATYGLSCRDFKSPDGRVNTVGKGNATGAVKEACGDAKDVCSFKVDAARIGDPAPGCQKDFTVRWRCGDLERIHQVFLVEEANAKTASLACP